MRAQLLGWFLLALAPRPPEAIYAEALAAARQAAAIHLSQATNAAELQSLLDEKARKAAEALRVARETIADQPYPGRSFGHRLVASVLLDLADDVGPIAADRAARYREEAAVALRLCASFDEPKEIQADCRQRLEALQQPDIPSILATHRQGLDACLGRVKGSFEWKGTLTAQVGEHGVASARLSPRPEGRLAALGPCVESWARTLPLPGPLDVEVPLVLRSTDR